MDSVPQFHVDSLLSLGGHQLDIWVMFFLWRVCSGSLKFSGTREAENKLGWLQERELEKTFFFFALKYEFYNRRKLEKLSLCLLGGEQVISVSRVGMKHRQGWDIKGQVNVSSWVVLRLAGNKHPSNPGVQLLHMDCRNASQRLLERTLGSKGSCAEELIG